MKKELKYLLGIFFVSIILRSILAFFIRSPTIFSDEYIYLKMAQSFFLDQNFLLNGVSVAKYPPLYSIIISFFYLFGDVNFIYYIIKVFNAVLISSVIFPLYYIAKRYLDFKKAIFISLAASFAAPYFIFNNFIMAENLYYPLTMWFIFCLHKILLTNKLRYFIISGLLSGLLILTKFFGFASLPVLGIMWLLYRRKISFSYVIYYYLVAFIMALPWFIRNFLVFGSTSTAVTAGYKSPFMLITSLTSKIAPFLNWNLTYFAYILIGSGVLFFLCFIALRKTNDESLKQLGLITLIYTFFTVIIAANLSTNYKFYLMHIISPYILPGRIIGRYVDFVLPIIIVLGYISYNKINFTKLDILISAVLSLFSLQLISNSLFPLNNSSLSILGLVQKVFSYLFYDGIRYDIFLLFLSTLLIAIFLIGFLILIIFNKKLALYLALMFLFLSSILSYSMIVWNSNIWYSSDQNLISDYIRDKFSPEQAVIIDKNYCMEAINKWILNTNLCDKGNYASLIGFFIINPVTGGNYSYLEKGDVFISREQFNNLNKVYQSPNNIFVYTI